MSPGQILRRLLGPLTDPVARLYRRFYVDLESWGRSLSRLGEMERVLEIGCGDGHLCEVLARQFLGASILGVDIAEDPGRLYKGPSGRVEFRQARAEDVLDAGETFDLVVMSDVLHHVPVSERPALIETAWDLTARGGHLAVKDWVRTRNLATLAAYVSDRFITGDRPSFFRTGESLIDLLETGCPGGSIEAEGSVPPHKNNLYLVLRKPERE